MYHPHRKCRSPEEEGSRLCSPPITQEFERMVPCYTPFLLPPAVPAVCMGGELPPVSGRASFRRVSLPARVLGSRLVHRDTFHGASHSILHRRWCESGEGGIPSSESTFQVESEIKGNPLSLKTPEVDLDAGSVETLSHSE